MATYLSAPEELRKTYHEYNRELRKARELVYLSHKKVTECDSQECAIWFLNTCVKCDFSVATPAIEKFLSKHNIVLVDSSCERRDIMWITGVRVQYYGRKRNRRELHSVKINTTADSFVWLKARHSVT